MQPQDSDGVLLAISIPLLGAAATLSTRKRAYRTAHFIQEAMRMQPGAARVLACLLYLNQSHTVAVVLRPRLEAQMPGKCSHYLLRPCLVLPPNFIETRLMLPVERWTVLAT